MPGVTSIQYNTQNVVAEDFLCQVKENRRIDQTRFYDGRSPYLKPGMGYHRIEWGIEERPIWDFSMAKWW
jgi:hypothetical protein